MTKSDQNRTKNRKQQYDSNAALDLKAYIKLNVLDAGNERKKRSSGRRMDSCYTCNSLEKTVNDRNCQGSGSYRANIIALECC
nr:hypothetical protein [Tanacetum cinerariifolium]